MESPYGLPDLALDDGRLVKISLQMLHEVDTQPSDTTRKVAEDAGLTVTELRKRVHFTLRSALAERRPSQKTLLDDFIPGNIDGIQAPMMNYGFAMSDEAMLYCARKLNVDQPREVYNSGVLVHTFKEDGIGYLGLTRSLLLAHLESRGRVPAGSITFEGYTGQGCPRVCSLFSNYDVRFKRERAKRFSKRSVDNIRIELIKGFEGFESGPRPRLMWYWDTIKCGFGYAAPWDEFNLVPRALTPQWNTRFDAGPIETTDDKPQSPRGRTSTRELERR